MKNRILLLLFLSVFSLSCLLPDKARANHGTGGELIYIHLGDSAYQFILKFYRDCSGPPAPNIFALCAFNTLTNTSFTVPMNRWTGPLPDGAANGSPISPGCSNSRTRCDSVGSIIPGFEEHWYECIVARLPFRANWRFGVLDGTLNPPGVLCCRNASYNIQNSTGQNFYIETGLNSTHTFKNSSPYYSIKPVPYVCINQPYSYNNGALDADGDSLWSYLVSPLATPHCSQAAVPILPSAPVYNLTNNPFSNNGSFQLNGNNGQFSWATSTLQGGAAVTTRTDEYRTKDSQATYQIGFVMRDVQVQTIICNNQPPKLDTASIVPGNGKFIDGKPWGCIDQRLDFCMMVASADTETVLKVSDNLKDVKTMPGATITYNDQGTDSVEVCFSWLPTINDVGAHQVILLVRDSTCKPPGILFNYAYAIDINVWGAMKASGRDTVCAGEPAFLGATGGGDYRWSVLSGTPNSLNDSTVANPIAYPRTNTRYLVRSTLNDYCDYKTTDTVDIEVIQGTQIAGVPDDTTCPGEPIVLDMGMVREPGVNYTISWTPTTGLDNPSIERPTATLKESQQYIVAIVSTKNRCVTRDTVDIDVLKGMSINNPDTLICYGSFVDITGEGDPRYRYTWTSADQAAQYTNPNGVLNRITPGDTGTYRYVLTGKFYKCLTKDTVTDIRITIDPIPTVRVNDDAIMCQGDTMLLEAVVDPAGFPRYTYDWSPGAMLDYTDKRMPIFSATDVGEFKLSVVVTTPAGCSATDEIELEVFSAKFMTLPNDTAICPGDTISLAMDINEGSKFYWLPDFNISSVSSQNPRVWPVTDQAYTVYGVDSFGCLDTQSVKIVVKPRAVLDMPDSVVIYSGEGYRMDPGGNCLYYTWFPPLGLNDDASSNPILNPKVNTRYIVHGRNEAGCSVIDSVDVLLRNDGILELPNAFTPGNGTFRVIRRGIADLKLFAIYNRWGTKVFETKDINEGWDGTYKGEMQPVGVYVYTVEAVTISGQVMQKQGNVTMIR